VLRNKNCINNISLREPHQEAFWRRGSTTPLILILDIFVCNEQQEIIKAENVSGRLGGVVVRVLATGPKGYGFKTRPRRWIFKGVKNPQHTFLSDGK
jgi:hypothetical protein